MTRIGNLDKTYDIVKAGSGSELEQIIATAGKTVFLPQGNYLLTKANALLNGTTLKGAHKDLVTIQTVNPLTGAFTIANNVHDIRIEDLTIDGQQTAPSDTSGNLIYNDRGYDIEVKRCKLYRGDKSGFFSTGGSNIRILDNHIEACYTPLAFNSVVKLWVKRNRVKTTEGDAFYFTNRAGAATACEEVFCSHNTAEEVTDTGFDFSILAAAQATLAHKWVFCHDNVAYTSRAGAGTQNNLGFTISRVAYSVFHDLAAHDLARGLFLGAVPNAIADHRTVVRDFTGYNNTTYNVSTRTSAGYPILKGYPFENRGTSTGTGAQQDIAHGLPDTPAEVILTEYLTGLAIPKENIVADATQIHPLATLNKDYRWSVKM